MRSRPQQEVVCACQGARESLLPAHAKKDACKLEELCSGELSVRMSDQRRGCSIG